MAEGGDDQESFYEREPRYGSDATAVGQSVFMYRGILQSYQGKSRFAIPSYCEVFDGDSREWIRMDTVGSNPEAYQHFSTTSIGDHIYYYGGYDGTTCTDQLFELDTQTMKFKELLPRNSNEGPMKKKNCGLVSLRNERLLACGGYGIPTTTQPGSRFVPDTTRTDGRGWTNELHCYDIKSGMAMYMSCSESDVVYEFI